MTGGTELREVQQVRIGKIGALVRRPPVKSALAPVAVVICPGHPASCSASSPLITALDSELALGGVPSLRLDYPSVGMSSDEKHPGQVYSGQRGLPLASGCLLDTITWAKRNLSSRIILCGYSFGVLAASQAVVEHGVQVEALILISAGIGLEVYADMPSFKSMADAVKKHTMLTCKTLYVVGTRDPMTPLAELLKLMEKRKDGGEGVSIETVQEGLHEMRGKETEVATVSTEWVKRLQDELINLPAATSEDDISTGEPVDDDVQDNGDQQVMFDLNGNILGVVDIDNRIRGGCRSTGCPVFNPPTGVLGRAVAKICLTCGALNTEHEDKGSWGVEY
mmetsp:Transcript_3474/g.5597  ORF Transcript_3474/g.5597 Transcript_3474/m.5597 type:complete len:337 (+) Transcript_3474:56-1066(+)